MSIFFLLDQQVRRNVFRFFWDDYEAAANLALAYPLLTHEIGVTVFQTYWAEQAYDMYDFLAALIVVPEFSPYVTTIFLTSPIDDRDQSGFFEWMLRFGDFPLPPGHLGIPVQFVGRQFQRFSEVQGAKLQNGILRGGENWPNYIHYHALLGAILPALCPNVLEVEIPAWWGDEAEDLAWNNFPNIEGVTMG